MYVEADPTTLYSYICNILNTYLMHKLILKYINILLYTPIVSNNNDTDTVIMNFLLIHLFIDTFFTISPVFSSSVYVIYALYIDVENIESKVLYIYTYIYLHNYKHTGIYIREPYYRFIGISLRT